jgi:plastocyanin
MRSKCLAFLALSVMLVALTGCGSSSSSSSGAANSATSSSSSAAPATSTSASASSSAPSGGAAPTPGGAVAVTMKNLAFSPGSVNAKVGQKIEWTNDDTAPHNVTYVSGPKFTSSGTLSTGGKFSVTATQAGTIHYVCTIHPFMKATIVVTK